MSSRTEGPKKVGGVIRRLRLEKNMTQADLAYEAEINVSYYCAVEHGDNNISLRKFISICHALQEQPDAVMSMILCDRHDASPGEGVFYRTDRSSGH